MSNFIKRLVLVFSLGAVTLAPVTPILAYTPFQENAVNEYRPLYDPFECDPDANSGDTPTNVKTGLYIALGSKLPIDGVDVHADTYGGGYRNGIGTKYYQSFPGWYPSNDQMQGEKPYDDDGIGADGKPLPGRTVFSELGNSLGNIPMGAKVEIEIGGKKIIAEKGDTGPGNGIGIWFEAARALDFKAGTGTAKVHAVSLDTPVTAVNGVSNPSTTAGKVPGLGNCCLEVDEATGGPLNGKDNAEKAFNFFKDKGLTEVQAAGIVGNLVQESGVDPHSHQGGGGVGRGIAQWSAGARWETLKSYASKTGRDPWSLAVQLDFLWKELTGDYKKAYDAIKKATTVAAAVKAFQNLYEICGQCNESGRIKYANTALKLFGNGIESPAAASNPAAGAEAGGTCGGMASGVVAGSMVKTAVGLAWPDPYGPKSKKAPHGFHTPTPAYKVAWIKASDYTDCGTFIATVMRKSGADPKYPPVSVGVQRDYVEKHPELYIIIKNPKSTKDLKPGDIMIVDGHTSMWVGPQAGGFTVAEASFHDHTPDMHTSGSATWMFGQPNPIIVRKK